MCPHCGALLYKDKNTLKCSNGHNFDISAAGYVNLLPPHRNVPGDSKEMVRARRRFLDGGYYMPLADTLLKFVREYSPGVFADIACGEGFYTNAIQMGMSKGVVFGIDISKFALAAASKRNPQICYCVSNLHQLPFPEGTIDMALCCFCPIDEGELARILHKGGRVLLVSPGEKHLWELKQILYELPYENSAQGHELDGFVLRKQEKLCYKFFLREKEDVQALYAMTPYYWKTSAAGTERLNQCETLSVTADFLIEEFERII